MTFFIFFGIISIISGFLIIIYNRSLVNFFGRIDWFERSLGPTGTFSFYKIVGILIIFIGLMSLTGDLARLIRAVAGFIMRIMALE